MKHASYLAILILGSLTWTVIADEKADHSSDYEFFEKRIRPVLIEHCSDCHRGAKPKSSLRVNTLSGLLTGGTRGPAIVPGDPKKSLLILAVNHADQQLHMPPPRASCLRARWQTSEAG